MTSVPGFLTKTFEIFGSPDYSDCCGWGQNGDTIIIRKIEQFSKHVLPKYFKHSNFQSFVRQLNMYDFHKTVQDPSHGEFAHPYFKQNRPDLLGYIKRKANNRNSDQSKKQGARAPQGNLSVNHSAAEHDHLALQELDGLNTIDPYYESNTGFEEKGDFEHRMEAKLGRVEEENRMLKRLFMESHQKNLVMQDRMEKVLKTLYSVFVGPGSGAAGKALASGRIPSMLLENTPIFPQAPMGLLMDASYEPQVTELPDGGDLDRLPSMDFGFGGPQGGGTVGTSATGMSGGSDLIRGTSFDFAAASVSAPSSGLHYLPSFDATYGAGSGAPLTRSNAFDLQSERVALMADNAPSGSGADAPEPEKEDADEVMDGDAADSSERPWNLRRLSKRRAASSNIYDDYVVPAPTPTRLVSKKPKVVESSMPPPQPSAVLDGVDLAQTDTRQFIDLLNRNQNTTLNRLDSLEQTIATLIDNMDSPPPQLEGTVSVEGSVTADAVQDGPPSDANDSPDDTT